MRMKNPTHPGDLIKTEIIEALGLNVSKAAEILKVRAPRSPTFCTPKPH
jgi:plasmid maintenance system antidote protein VapI